MSRLITRCHFIHFSSVKSRSVNLDAVKSVYWYCTILNFGIFHVFINSSKWFSFYPSFQDVQEIRFPKSVNTNLSRSLTSVAMNEGQSSNDGQLETASLTDKYLDNSTNNGDNDKTNVSTILLQIKNTTDWNVCCYATSDCISWHFAVILFSSLKKALF